MQWLFIDTSHRGECRYGTIGDRISIRSVVARSGMLLPKLALKHGALLRTIDGICVVSGPGSFSAIRSGVLVANLLSRLLAKPLVGVSVSDASDLEHLSRDLATHRYQPTSFVAPVYDAEPNITVPKHV